MARLPDIRVSYSADVQKLSRLLVAVERDNKHGKDWQERTVNLLRELIMSLTFPGTSRNDESKKKTKP
jgi:hypothetical protein